MLRPKLNRIWAGNSAPLRRDPGDIKYIQGWISEIPTYQVLNYLQYKIDTTLLAQAERGIFEWGTDVQYGTGSVVWDELDKTIYVSIVASPDRTKSPSLNTSQWRKSAIQVSRNEYDSIVAAINAHIADITGNPHQLTAGRLNAYNKAEVDNLVTQYRALVSAHASDINNPHKLTALGIGAVPSTGGTYTGDVVFNGLYLDAAKTKELYGTGGLYLKNGNGVIGISDAGVPEAGTLSAKSQMILDKDYATYKKTQESLYAVPHPVFMMNLNGDINIQSGNSTLTTATTTPYEPTYSADGSFKFGRTINTTENVSVSSNPLGTATEGTLVVDVLYEGALSSSVDAPYTINIGNPNANIKLNLRNNGSGNGCGPLNTVTPSWNALSQDVWHRIAITFNSTTTSVYVDGVLSQTLSAVNPAMSAGSASLIQTSATSVEKAPVRIKNLRAWTVALTPEQISRL